MDARSPQANRTIFVDLDGTLIRTDLLWETLFLLARQKPQLLIKLPYWLAMGKANLKAALAAAVLFDPASLPYREELLEELRAEKAAGRRIVLATAANEVLAHSIAKHLGIFDAVMASDTAINLSAERKLDRILAGCGDDGFDYVGNSRDDICLLEKAVEAVVVAPDLAAARWQKSSGSRRIDDTGGSVRPMIKAMRPHQWMKNLLLFVPLVLAHAYFEPIMILAVVLAFASFSFAASSVYILNDLMDLESDRRHKTKRLRPFASGALPIRTGLLLALVLLLLAVSIAAILPPEFMVVLIIYLVTTTAYSFFLKRMLLIDVLALAGLYTIRILAGAEASGVAASFWLLAFSVFFFLSLALVKRFTELKDFGIGAHRSTTGRGYVDADLETLGQAGMASGFAAVTVLALYIDSVEVQLQFDQPYLAWPLCPLVLYIIVRIWILARRGEMHEDPVVFILRDWRSQIMIGLGGIMYLVAAYA